MNPAIFNYLPTLFSFAAYPVTATTYIMTPMFCPPPKSATSFN